VSSIVKSHTGIVENYGGNLTMVAPYFSALSSMVSVIARNPSEAQKIQIREKTTALLNAGLALIKSQVGLENVETDTNLMAQPENLEFFQILAAIRSQGQANLENPASAYASFTNSSLPQTLARLTILTLELSNRVKSQTTTCELLNSTFHSSTVLNQGDCCSSLTTSIDFRLRIFKYLE
jgi:hypothetical protein